MKKIKIILIFVIILSINPGCSYNNGASQVQRIKIMGHDPTMFNLFYASKIKEKFPELIVEFVSMSDYVYFPGSEERIEKEIKKENPDILILDGVNFRALVSSNVFQPLDKNSTPIKKTLEVIDENLMDIVRYAGEGTVYGIPTMFDARALYYNKEIFEKYKIPFPKDGITWREMIDLATRFPKDSGSEYGLEIDFQRYIPKIMCYKVINYFMRIEKEIEVTPDMKNLLVGNSNWKDVYEKITDLMKQRIIFPNLQDLKETNDVDSQFLQGKSAMIIGKYGILSEVSRRNIDYGVVNSPIKYKGSEVFADKELYEIFCIPKSCNNIESATEVLSLLGNKDLHQNILETFTSYIPTHKDVKIKNKNGKEIECFQKGKIDLEMKKKLERLDENFIEPYVDMFENITCSVLRNQLLVDEACEKIIKEAQAILDKANMIRKENLKSLEEKNK